MEAPKALRLGRAPATFSALLLCDCQLDQGGRILPVGEPRPWERARLARLFAHHSFIYAKSGDYIGHVRVLESPTDITDFQISPHHPHLQDPRWLSRVVTLYRVVAIVP